jgi:hypothetical protein
VSRDERSNRRNSRWAVDLARLAECCEGLDGIAKEELAPGDRVVVTTENSTYCLSSLGGGVFAVSGGWFDRFGGGEVVVRLNGCTFGGRAIHEELVAAPGLFLEFANGVVTSRIVAARLQPGGASALLS